ncbi:MAG: diguanylate cyclase [Gammaproteobacteria bacterium]|nr:diguanylate cyclase [Gammaproteobacteria bacterium]
MFTRQFENFSVQHLAIAAILLVGISSISSIWVAENIFHDAITTSIQENITSIIDVAVQETTSDTRTRAIEFTNRTQNYSDLRSVLKSYLKNPQDSAAVVEQLNMPFIKGYVDALHLELLKFRLYDTNYRLLTESSHGIELPYGLPQFLKIAAIGRKGSERLKALGGLWSANGQPLYSVLVPIGGLRTSGYLEAVFNPAYTIGTIDHITQIPVIVTSSSGDLLYRSESINLRSANRLPVKQAVLGDDGSVVFKIQSFEDVSQIYDELYAAKTILGGGLLVTNILIIIFVIWLLYRFLVNPLLYITRNIDKMGDSSTAKVYIEPTGLREFKSLAIAFNTMCDTVRSHTIKLELLSSMDGLTNIANRRSFDESLRREWRHCVRDQHPISLLYIDIDYFKNYNDYYGHSKGDECLIHIAQLIESYARRPSDLAARYGGEEFVVLLSDTDAAGAQIIAQALLEAVNQAHHPHEKSEVADHITLSIGVSTLTPTEVLVPEQLIKLADKALYRAKSEGRNRISIA